MGSVNCGVYGLIFPSAEPENASLTESVAAIITESGPAAASIPFLEAMDSNEAVGGGRESTGHEEGSKRSFDSPAIAENPIACEIRQSLLLYDL